MRLSDRVRASIGLVNPAAAEELADEVRALEDERDLLLAIDAASCAGTEAAAIGTSVDGCPHPPGPPATAWRGGWSGMTATLERDALRTALEVELERWQSLPPSGTGKIEHEAGLAVRAIRKALGRDEP